MPHHETTHTLTSSPALEPLAHATGAGQTEAKTASQRSTTRDKNSAEPSGTRRMTKGRLAAAPASLQRGQHAAMQLAAVAAVPCVLLAQRVMDGGWSLGSPMGWLLLPTLFAVWALRLRAASPGIASLAVLALLGAPLAIALGAATALAGPATSWGMLHLGLLLGSMGMVLGSLLAHPAYRHRSEGAVQLPSPTLDGVGNVGLTLLAGLV